MTTIAFTGSGKGLTARQVQAVFRFLASQPGPGVAMRHRALRGGDLQGHYAAVCAAMPIDLYPVDRPSWDVSTTLAPTARQVTAPGDSTEQMELMVADADIVLAAPWSEIPQRVGVSQAARGLDWQMVDYALTRTRATVMIVTADGDILNPASGSRYGLGVQ